MTEPSGYVLETLWEDGEFVLSRGVRDGEPSPLLVVAPASAQPSPGSLARLEHAYALRDELDPAWAARPLRLVRHRGRPTLVLEDPGGEPLARLLGQPWEITSFLRVAIGLATALGRLHERGLIHKDVKPAHILVNAATGARLADRLRHRLAPAARAPGPRAARGDRRDARLHGAGTDRPHEPLGRFPQRSLCAGRHLLRDADGGAALHRRRSDGVGPLPHRPAADAAGRAGRTESPGRSRRS